MAGMQAAACLESLLLTMSSSSRPIAGSRVSGKKLHWPVMAAGRTHAFASPDHTAQLVCLKSENRSDCIKMHEALIAKHAPATTIEHCIVQHIAVNRWRLQRARAIESVLVDNQMDLMRDNLAETHGSMDEAVRATLAFRKLIETSPSFKFLQKYKRSLTRQSDRSLAGLTAFRASAETKIANEA